jgi:hypothetical protein
MGQTTATTAPQESEGSPSLRIVRAHSWLRAALTADDLDAKFIFLWIGFNALYGQEFTADRVDRACFLERIQRDESGTIYQALLAQRDSVFDLLGLEFLYREYWREGYTDALAETIVRNQLAVEMTWAAGRSETCLPAIFECLYELRNQILHGSAKFGSSKNRDSLEAAVPILKELLPAFCAVVKRSVADHEWGQEAKPPRGSKTHPRDKRRRLNPIRIKARNV